jgi:hypothetical protein
LLEQQKRIDEQRVICIEKDQNLKKNSMTLLNKDAKFKTCPHEFDSILCWSETKAGEWSYQKCPKVVGFKYPNKFAKRYCTPAGTWIQRNNTNKSFTDYEKCYKDENEDKDSDKIIKVEKMKSSILSNFELTFFY